MTTRSSSSSSSSSATEVISERARGVSETSGETTQTGSRIREESATNTIDGTSLGESMTVRSTSPSASHMSATATRSGYDTVSVATTTNTGITNATATSRQSQETGSIPIIRPPVLQQQQQGPGTGVGVFGPQRPAGYPTQPPIQVDVASAQQQYQQRTVQAEISPYSGSTSSSSVGSFASPGNTHNQQQRFDVAKAIFTQVDTNRDGAISREEFQQWAHAGNNQASGQFQHQQQYPNQIPASQVYNELLGPDAFKDVILDIDYGAMGELNTAFQSSGDFASSQLPPGIAVRPAYTPVDSLNFQQHMFNTARTRTVGGTGGANSYDTSGASNSYNVGGGQQFDVAKAIFKQADTNRDGGISREEFQQWAQGGQQNYGGQSYTNNAANYQTTAPNYGNGGGGGGGSGGSGGGGGGGNSGFYHAALFDGADPGVANILQQSGLGQVVPH